jgi:hypothetical protein
MQREVFMSAQVKLTPELVRGLWDYMSKTYQSRVLDKRTSDLMDLCGWGLDLMGIQDREQFLQDFSTTFFDTIWIPFEIGKPVGKWDLWLQIVICVHEHHHVVQCRRDGALEFASKYLASDTERAVYEAEAYRGAVELHWWRWGTILDTAKLARRLLHYGCTETEVHFVDEYLKVSADAIRHGAVINETSNVAIAYLES